MSYMPIVHIGMPKCASTWLQRHLFTRAHGYNKLMGPFEAHLAFMTPRPFAFDASLDVLGEVEPGMVPAISAENL